MEINPSELRVDTFRTGASNWVNEPLKGVRITHLPSGRIFESTDKRSQHANRAEAYKMLEQFLTTYKPTKQGNNMQKTPQLIAHLNTLGVADVELKNNNVVKIHFQQGVSQKTWSKKELTDICNAFIAGMEASNVAQHPFLAKVEAQLLGMQAEPNQQSEMEKVTASKKQVADFWGTVAAKPDLEPAPVERLG